MAPKADVPTVSVVMPVRNCEHFVEQSIESVFAQSFPNWELIVVDDASTDRTVEIIEGYRGAKVTILRNDSQLGVSRSLNRGLELCAGDLIARLDSDDYSRSDRLARQVEQFQMSPELGLVGSWVRTVGKRNRKLIFPTEDYDLKLALCFRNPFVHSSVMFRSENKRGEKWHYRDGVAQDYELWTRISSEYEIRNIPDFLTTYRRHEHQTTQVFASSYPAITGEIQTTAREIFGMKSSRSSGFNSILDILELLRRCVLEARNIKKAVAYAREATSLAFRSTSMTLGLVRRDLIRWFSKNLGLFKQ